MKPLAILLASILLAACGQKTATSHAKQSETPGKGNTMNCVAGDIKLAGTGEPEVGLASFGIQGNTITGFGLSLDVEHDGKAYQVSSSLMPLPMETGTFHFPSLTEPGMTLASFNVRTSDRDLLKGYNGGTYSQQYSAVENDPEAKLKIQVDKMTVSDAPLPGFKRVHAVGQFEFNAAALPASSPSDDCVKNGIARSIIGANSGKRTLPLFDAAICGAEKKHVQCDFDVVADLVKLQ
ncbi:MULTISPECIES: hypothetical protein [unclassified Duganella]|uniref:hypothetical protein n=1 Tax=unclassified Duganella TaxID=2636909 RepID=UPI0006F54220|nr:MULTISPECIES: hypothetical protein [unclassified Duganella]KQV61446.1 hypothetical protein ASD07_00855 [Duganella sp. Root336D2]KRB92463.1 hypothetical protein ASE26_05720 [Duganella sp. Root198D2]